MFCIKVFDIVNISYNSHLIWKSWSSGTVEIWNVSRILVHFSVFLVLLSPEFAVGDCLFYDSPHFTQHYANVSERKMAWMQKCFIHSSHIITHTISIWLRSWCWLQLWTNSGMLYDVFPSVYIALHWMYSLSRCGAVKCKSIEFTNSYVDKRPKCSLKYL